MQQLFGDYSAASDLSGLVHELNTAVSGYALDRPVKENARSRGEVLRASANGDNQGYGGEGSGSNGQEHLPGTDGQAIREDSDGCGDTELYPWRARWHLERERNCNLDDCYQAGVRYDAKLDCLYFPLTPILLRTGSGDTVPHMSRTASKRVKDWRFGPEGIEKERYWFAPCWTDPAEVVLVEGPFDILSPGLLGSAIALCGTQLYEDAHYFFSRAEWSRKTVFLWLDEDEAGKAAAPRIKKQLQGVVGKVVLIDYHKEPGDCSREEVKGVLGWV